MSSVRRQYPFHLIEPKWQQAWDQEQTFRAWNPGDTLPADHPFAKRHGLNGRVAHPEDLPPKFYILDMFPYPSGAGLHVGHPEGYTATDILARYRRAQGFNVLHPMGWDAFGLPAEQYAIKTGQHPRQTTEGNVATFKRQIQSLGFSYDWSREVNTTDPGYFRWTQWIFLQLYHSYFDPEWNKATPIALLEDALSDEPARNQAWKDNAFLLGIHFAWRQRPASERDRFRRHFIDHHRLAYVSEAPVNWCPELGTVLANEEVIDGKSEVGGFPVIRKPMRQWMLRITAYAERLLNDLDTIDWSGSLKEMQRNWIGRSEGAEVDFEMADGGWRMADSEKRIRVFTTRPDTLFGATYLVLSPEHKLVDKITTSEQRKAVEDYKAFAATKSDLERTELAKEKTGVSTGAYAINPVNGQKIPIWIADYVLISYGTGAIMAVPAHDERDWEFAANFGLPIWTVVESEDQRYCNRKPVKLSAEDINLTNSPGFKADLLSRSAGPFKGDWIDFPTRKEAEEFFYVRPYDFGEIVPAPVEQDGKGCNSAFLNGLPTPEAKKKTTAWLESKGLGKRTINYKLRDWLFSRQRYWGEPFPIVWKDGHHEALPESALPVLPPALDDYKPTADGQPPLARAKEWLPLPDGSTRETNTMPQWAGSCWYYLRYLDAANAETFVGREAERYWMGGVNPESEIRNPKSPTPGVDLYVGGTEHAVLHLLYARFWHKVLFDLGHVSTPEPFFKLVNQGLILGEDGQKMSKARGNVVNPDDMVKHYGADSLRLYEMFMGPLEMVKPWSTQGVSGVYKFLGRVWRLFVDEPSETEFEQQLAVAANPSPALLGRIALHSAIREVPATPAQLKTLHACIKKVTEDLDGLRFNTAISAMMVFVNEAMAWETRPVSALKTFLQLLAPFAPHLAEELWAKLHSAFRLPPSALGYAPWPPFDAGRLVEDTIEIPVQVNGKLRDVIRVPAGASRTDLEAAALRAEKAQPFLAGKTVRKIIVVPGKLVNVVVA